MKNKFTVFFVLTAFIFSITACAAVPVARDSSVLTQHKSAVQMKYEREEENRALFVKGGGTFVCLVLGGLVGLLVSPKKNAVTSTIAGCVIGGAVGFGLGSVVFERTKPSDTKPDDAKVKEYFEQYQYIQLEK